MKKKKEKEKQIEFPLEMKILSLKRVDTLHTSHTCKRKKKKITIINSQCDKFCVSFII